MPPDSLPERFNTLTAAEQDWLKLARSMPDEVIAHKLREFAISPPESPPALRSMAAVAIVAARRKETTGA